MREKFIRSILAVCFSAAILPVLAQPALPDKYIEHPGFSLGWHVGLTDLWGDVGTQSVVDHYYNENYWDKPCFMGGMFIRYSPHPAVALRAGGSYGTLYANDNWNYTKAKKLTSMEDDAYQRYLRNQDVRANVWEAGLLLEFTPLRLNVESRSAARRMQPYILAGASYFHFKPMGTYINRQTGKKSWANLADLHLEGEGLNTPNSAEKTELWQLAIPVGLGLRWDLNETYAIGVEYLYRYTMTDRLDMVSSEYVDPAMFSAHLSPEQAAVAMDMYDKSWLIEPSVNHQQGELRGNSAVNDAFSTISVTFIYKIKSNKIPWWF